MPSAVVFEIASIISLALALIPALLIAVNLRLYRAAPLPDPDYRPQVSLLIPARDEETRIEAALQAALASQAVDLEVIVLDDHSSDRTAELVRNIAQCDERLRLATAPELPSGWSGKQHACHILATLARHPLLIFTDADVRLAPDALARVAAFMRHRPVGLASGFPWQETRTPAEKLIIPLIHFLLLGFLPIWQMRRRCRRRCRLGIPFRALDPLSAKLAGRSPAPLRHSRFVGVAMDCAS